MRHFFLVILIVNLFACHSGAEMNDVPAREIADLHVEPTGKQTSPAGAQEKLSPRFIKTGNIRLLSDDVQRDYEQLLKKLPAYDAYIEDENQYNTAEQKEWSLVVRVNAERFDSLVSLISKMGLRLDNRSVHTSNVSEQYYDLESRIRNKKVLESSYLKLLERASKVSDILEVERNLNEVRTEIEQLEGQFKYLGDQIAYSTIHVSFYEMLPYNHSNASGVGFFDRIYSAFYNGWDAFLSFLVGLFTLWPFLLLTPVIVYGFRKIKRRRRDAR